MTTRICVSILPKNRAEALWLIEQAEITHADLIEVRLDHLKNQNILANLASHCKTPKIATDKASRTEMEHQQMLISAAKSGFEYVDIDHNEDQILLSEPVCQNNDV